MSDTIAEAKKRFANEARATTDVDSAEKLIPISNITEETMPSRTYRWKEAINPNQPGYIPMREAIRKAIIEQDTNPNAVAESAGLNRFFVYNYLTGDKNELEAKKAALVLENLGLPLELMRGEAAPRQERPSIPPREDDKYRTPEASITPSVTKLEAPFLSPEMEALIRARAIAEGKTPDEVVEEAFSDLSEKEKLIARMDEIARRCAALPLLDNRTPDEIMDFDEFGLPR